MSAGPQTPGDVVGDSVMDAAGSRAVRWLTSRSADRLDAMTGEIAAHQRPATRPLLVGAGEGVLRSRLQRRFGSCAVLDPAGDGLRDQRHRRPDLASPHADALHLPFPDGAFDLVVCLEVLELLRDPAAGLRELARVSSRHLLLAVPHEPFFRAAALLTGRPVRGPGTTRSHLQHWTGAGFQRFVSTQLNVRSVASPCPWTVVWATKVG